MPHLTIEAGPGSGKTFTLEKGHEFLQTKQILGYTPTSEQMDIYNWLSAHVPPYKPYETVFLAFNKDIQLEMERRLSKNTRAYTFNALGQSIVIKRRHFHEYCSTRAQELVEQLLNRKMNDLSYKDRVYWALVIRYCNHLKEELLTPTQESLNFIQDRYLLHDIPLPEDTDRLLRLMLVPNKKLDYSDQVWMGLQCLDPTKKPYKVLWCDEAQDLSVLRLEFCLNLADCCIFCGDPYQSINAFAGADFQAFEKVRAVSKNSGGTTLPLKTCFRCPPNIIERINTIRPARLKAYKKEPGPIERLHINELAKRVLQLANRASGNEIPDEYCTVCDCNLTRGRADQGTTFSCGCDAPTIEKFDPTIPAVPDCGASLDNYLMISRTNANLIRAAIALSKHQIPVTIVKRRSDDDNTEEVLTKYFVTHKCTNIEHLLQSCQRDLLRADKLPFRQGIVLRDKAECMIHLANSCTSLTQLIPKLKSFNTNTKGSVKLSTIHKAKGLEFPFVFILFPPIPHPKAITENEIEQERNLQFVAESRTMYYTAFVSE